MKSFGSVLMHTHKCYRPLQGCLPASARGTSCRRLPPPRRGSRPRPPHGQRGNAQRANKLDAGREVSHRSLFCLRIDQREKRTNTRFENCLETCGFEDVSRPPDTFGAYPPAGTFLAIRHYADANRLGKYRDFGDTRLVVRKFERTVEAIRRDYGLPKV